MISENNLKLLEERHNNDVENIRKEFGEQLSKNVVDKNEAQREMNRIKKEYEARLYELEQENEVLLKEVQ
jgi:ribosomal protein S20